jgi:hypothetical protein
VDLADPLLQPSPPLPPDTHSLAAGSPALRPRASSVPSHAARFPSPLPLKPSSRVLRSSLRPPSAGPASSLLLSGRHHFVRTRRRMRSPRRRSSEHSARAVSARSPAVRPPYSRPPSAAGMVPIRPALAPWPRHLLRCVLLLGGLRLGHPADSAAALLGKALPTWPTSGVGPLDFSLLFFSHLF